MVLMGAPSRKAGVDASAAEYMEGAGGGQSELRTARQLQRAGEFGLQVLSPMESPLLDQLQGLSRLLEILLPHAPPQELAVLQILGTSGQNLESKEVPGPHDGDHELLHDHHSLG